jgi:putative ABC transport system permease protein
MLADLRFALRALGRAPGFVLAAVLCLGLGLGANTTVYSLVNSLILRPLPYGESERLLAVVHEHAAQGVVRGDITLAAVLDVAERSRTLDGLAATDTRLVNLTGVDRPEALAAASVSGNYFDLLRVRPLVGRVLRAEESRPGAAPVVVLGEQLWRERFAGDPSAVGRAIALDGKPYTIVGVVPDAAGMSGDRERLFVPLVHERDPAQRGWHSYDAIARLKPGVTLEAARAELRSIGARLATEFPESDRGWTIDALSLRESLVPGEVATVFAVMLGAVGFVLLIAAANVANLLLARTAGRARELAVRAALGAGRARVLRLVLLESVIVALGGGLLGVAVAFVGVRALRDSIPVNYPAWLSFEVDWRVLAYAFALSVGTGLLFGLAPALRATRRALAPTLREQGRASSGGAGARRLRDGLVVTELALSLVLLVGAALMTKSMLRLQAIDPGFRAAGVLAARVRMGGERYAATTARSALLGSAVDRLGALPGVVAVSATSAAPLSGSSSGSTFVVEGREVPVGEAPSAETRAVLPGYFRALELPLVAGRDFTAAEAADTATRAVIVNETMARRWWPGADAIGRRVSITGSGADAAWMTVVGVTRDVRQRRLGRAAEEQLYLPFAAMTRRDMTLMVRTAGDPETLAPAVRDALAALDATLPVADLRTMPAMVHASLWQQRLYGTLFGTFAAVAVLLAVVGVYGVIAYAVAQRVRELGVRIALGARPRDVAALMLRDGARLATLGLGVGIVLALGITHVLGSTLQGVSPRDPAVLVGVAAVLGAAALVACWIPARRAARVDPLVAMRAD